MTSTEFERYRQLVCETLDQTMPGRRIGSAPPPDWTVQVSSDLDRLGDALELWTAAWCIAKSPDSDLGITSVTQFCWAHELPRDERYVREFRRQAILRRMARAG